MPTPALRARLANLAARQHAVVTREELHELGVTDHAIDWALRAAVLTRLFPGVYRVNGAPDTWHGRALAAQRRVERQLRRKDPDRREPPLVAIGGEAAAHLHGFPGFGSKPQIVVVTSRRCRSRSVQVATRRCLQPRDVTLVSQIPTITAARTVVEVGAAGPRDRAADLVAHVLVTGRLGRSQLIGAANRAVGVPGRRRVLDVLATPGGHHRSRTERRVADACVAAGLPAPALNAVTETELGLVELDLSWEDVHFNVEVDGPHHLLKEQRNKDRRRDRALWDWEEWEVLRVPVADVDDDVHHVATRIARVHRIQAALWAS